MEIRLAEDRDSMMWDGYLNGCGSQPPLNLYSWKKILEESYKLETFFFIALDENKRVCGILPTYAIKDLRGRKRLYSLRFGLNADNNGIQKRLLVFLEDFRGENRIASISVTSGYQRIDTGFQGTEKKTIMMELRRDENSVWKSFRDKTRNMIRKAQKSGLTAERGFHNLRPFYNVYASNMLKKGIAIHSFKFFEKISEKMGGDAELIVAKKNGMPIGGTLALFSKDIAIYPFQAASIDSQRFAPNDFMVWETIRSCIDRGISKLDMGESREGGNVYRFKTNFGGKPQDIHYYTIAGKSEFSEKGQRTKRPRSRLSLKGGILSKSPHWLARNMGAWIKSKERLI